MGTRSSARSPAGGGGAAVALGAGAGAHFNQHLNKRSLALSIAAFG